MSLDVFNGWMATLNGVIWHSWVLYAVLATGILFTIWSGFCQFRALTHGPQVIRGGYDDDSDPGAISHFQALSAALSATVGLGNIAGVAVAIGLGGPGAVFYMWIVGFVGMALKTTEVHLAMLHRNTDDPENPHGGPMFVASRGFAKLGLAPVGKALGGVFVVTLLIAAITGGNMFQAWNVAAVTEDATGLPQLAVGVVLAAMVALVIIGGVKRIGAVAGRLVPIMVAVYLVATLYVLAVQIVDVPRMFGLIFTHAFAPAETKGAFVGATVGLAFSWGMQRALFSSESGQGSSPIAHSAAKTREPVREAVVAGLEPFIDTIVVCTLTALVILASGAWDRSYEAPFGDSTPRFVQVGVDDEGTALWSLDGAIGGLARERGRDVGGSTILPAKTFESAGVSGEWAVNDGVFVVVRVFRGSPGAVSGSALARLQGIVRGAEGGPAGNDALVVDWASIRSAIAPAIERQHNGVYADYVGGALTTYAFDRVRPGLGTWLVLLASWLFALSTQISWSYYGEQGIVFLFGERGVMPYKFIYCLLIVIATLGFIRTDTELNNFTNIGTGLMLWANIPILLVFGPRAMHSIRDYFRRLKAGEFGQE
ncbi:MAG: alanine/glycine:cation symporter family protein [Thermoanaerobaculia bacterium]